MITLLDRLTPHEYPARFTCGGPNPILSRSRSNSRERALDVILHSFQILGMGELGKTLPNDSFWGQSNERLDGRVDVGNHPFFVTGHQPQAHGFRQ